MFRRRRTRTRLIIFLFVVLAVIFWRGIKSSAQEDFDCRFKLIYAVCSPKNNNAEFPSLIEILKAGTSFNF